MSTTTLLILLVVLFLVFGGFGYRRWRRSALALAPFTPQSKVYYHVNVNMTGPLDTTIVSGEIGGEAHSHLLKRFTGPEGE